MKELLNRLEHATDLAEIQSLVDGIFDAARNNKATRVERRYFLHHLLFNQALISHFATSAALDHLFASIAVSYTHLTLPTTPYV